MNIPAIIHKDENSVYGVTIPDIPGCFSFGETIEQAIQNTKEAIYTHLELMGKLNEHGNIKVSSIDELANNPDFRGSTLVLIDLVCRQ